ncbi:VanZ family protein [Aliivibrio kagoshimensis]|uniref:VanZ family protein n=1 Tax=Aliivibrio kagoshimensis TaxID=2910230 RepID=UPI003D12DAA6
MLTIFHRTIKWVETYWVYLALTVLMSITVLSLLPLAELPPNVPGSDKLHHFIAYAALMFPITLGKPKHLWFIALLLVGYSGGIELLQPYVNRYGEWLDLAANSGGLFMGWVMARGVLLLIPHHHDRGYCDQN